MVSGPEVDGAEIDGAGVDCAMMNSAGIRDDNGLKVAGNVKVDIVTSKTTILVSF